MSYWVISVFFALFSLLECSENLSEDLKHVLDSYEPDPKCVFNHTEVTSKTIKFFPKCETVFGVLVLNEHSDLTATQLKNSFKNMKSLAGGMRVENSKLVNLDFLNLENLMCETYGIFILNNSQLTSATALGSINIYGDDFGNECNFQVKNNTKLDAEGLCDIGRMKLLMDVTVDGNMKDCGCPTDEITEESLKSYESCSKLFGGFESKELLFNDKADVFSKVKYIRGGINIVRSGFTNLSFFENLETIIVNNEGEGKKFVLNLDYNVIMETLAFPRLKEVKNMAHDGIKLANIQTSDPRFCLTIEEIILFLEQEVSFLNLEAKICNDTRAVVANLNVCNYTTTLSSAPGNCNLVIGGIIIRSGEEDNVYKLSNVSFLFGMLAIENTSLVDLNFLDNLRYIVQFNRSSPVAQIVGNKKLESAVIKNIVNIITNGNRSMIFQDNNSELFKNKSCNLFPEQNSTSRNYRMRLDYIGGDCGDRVDIVYRFSIRYDSFFVLILLIVVKILLE